MKTLEGVIVAWTSPRVYYIESLEESGGGQPPDCSSEDGVYGNGVFGPGSEGNPTGRCEGCPMNVWGSADNGKGKACREMRRLVMLTEGSVLPMVVTLPPTSIRPLKQYMLRLAANAKFYYGVTTKMELESHNDGGRRWSTVVPSLGSQLTPEQTAAAKAVGDQMRRAMEATPRAAATQSPAEE